jgi:hypothetical protein
MGVLVQVLKGTKDIILRARAMIGTYEWVQKRASGAEQKRER